MIIYKATNKINGKVYIGYTSKSLNERIKLHLKKATNSKEKSYNQSFKLAIRKYGISNFDWEILYECNTKEEAFEKEIECIRMYNSITPNGYNMTFGGEGGIPNDEVKSKISKSLKEFFKENPRYNINKYLEKTTHEERSNKCKEIYRKRLLEGKGFKTIKTRSIESRKKQSETKARLNSQVWYNILTKEIVIASCLQMSKLTNISSSTFTHLKNKRQAINKQGWIHIGSEDCFSNYNVIDLEEKFKKFSNRFKFGIS
jgi:group I intron endonuclease